MKSTNHKILYNTLIEGIDSSADLLLRMNDLYKINIMIAKAIFEIESNPNKKAVYIDSIKSITNNHVNELVKIVSEEEMKTIEKNEK